LANEESGKGMPEENANKKLKELVVLAGVIKKKREEELFKSA
jgi:hypothetical protein